MEEIVYVVMLSSMCSNTIPWGRNHRRNRMCRDAVFYVPIQSLEEEIMEEIVCVVMLSSMCSNTFPWRRTHGRNRMCRDVVFYVFQYISLEKNPWTRSYVS